MAVRLAMPRFSGDDLAGVVEDARRDARRPGPGRRRGRRGRRAFHGAIVEIAGNATLRRVWRSSSRTRARYITLVVPGADPQWSADLHAPILRAMARDTDAVVAALERDFADVAANMARRLPDRTEDEAPA